MFRNRLRWTMRAMVLLTIAIGIGLGIWRYQTRGPRAIEAITRLRGDYLWVDQRDGVPLSEEDQFAQVDLGFAWTGERAGLEHLRDIPRLGVLQIGRITSVDDRAMQTIGDLQSVQWLSLQDLHVGDEGLREIGRLRQLVTLELINLDVTDRGMAHLRGLNDLELLGLERVAVQSEGIRTLADLPKLRWVTRMPTGAWRRLYSLMRIRRTTLSTSAASNPLATISAGLRSFSM